MTNNGQLRRPGAVSITMWHKGVRQRPGDKVVQPFTMKHPVEQAGSSLPLQLRLQSAVCRVSAQPGTC